MRLGTFLIALSIQLFAQINITSFQADFEQTITNEQNKTLRYEGEIHFKAPDKLLWIYKKPIEKKIVIANGRIVIVEPELEQATIKKMKEKTLFALLKKAKKVDKNHYKLQEKNKNFDIYFQKGVLKKVRYIDEFGNENEVVFANQRQNEDLNDSIFSVEIDPDYDIIYQ